MQFINSSLFEKLKLQEISSLYSRNQGIEIIITCQTLSLISVRTEYFFPGRSYTITSFVKHGRSRSDSELFNDASFRKRDHNALPQS